MNFLSKTIFPDVAAADPIWILLQVFKDTIRRPAATNIVADDGVKHIRAVGPRRSCFTDNLFDLIY